MPTVAEATYTVFDPEMVITMAPEFAQQPPCAYTADMTFKWTIPTGAPIYQQTDPYSLMIFTTNIDNDGLYTVFLENHIEYDGVTWDETVSYEITIVNPCVNTELVYTNTVIQEMNYEVTATAETQSFTPVTDTISDAITTSGNCGSIIYTLQSNDTSIGTGFMDVIDLNNAKGLRIYTEDDANIGNYTVTVTATMERYPTKTISFEVPIYIEEPLANLPTTVTYAPILETDISESFRLEPGNFWSLEISATDVDDDLSNISLDFSSNSGDWLAYDSDA